MLDAIREVSASCPFCGQEGGEPGGCTSGQCPEYVARVRGGQGGEGALRLLRRLSAKERRRIFAMWKGD